MVGSNAVFTANLSAATAEVKEPEISSNVLHRTLWWTWESPGYGCTVIRKRSAGEPPVAGIYARSGLQALNLIASSATEFGNECYRYFTAHDSAEWDTVPGGQYEIQIDRFPHFVAATPAEFELVFLPAPTNDTSEGAIALEGLETSLTVSNTNSTRRPGELTIPTQSGANSVWFKRAAPSRGIVQVTRFEPIRYQDPAYWESDHTLSRSVWWEWHAPAAGRWTLFVVKGGGENKFVVYRGDTAATQTEAGTTTNQPLIFACAAGETFQIGVFALAGFGGNIDFTLTPVVAPSPRLLSVMNYSWGDRSVQLQLPDNSGLSYVVDRSDDLATWTPVSTNANAWSHVVSISSQPGKPAEFFRTRLQDSPLP